MPKNFIIRTGLLYKKSKYRIKNKLNLFNDVIAYPYYGFGNESEAFLKGRVIEKETLIHGDEVVPNTLYCNLKKSWKRYSSNEIPGVGVTGTFNGVEANSITDNEGYFDLRLKKS